MLSGEVQLALATLALGLVTPFLYGIFVVLFITSTYLLILRRMKSTENHKISFRTFLTPIICFNILMFLTVTAGCLLICIRVFGAFANGSITAYFYSDLSNTIEVVKTPFVIASQAITDILIMYRLWVVWDKNYYHTVFPLLGILGYITCGIGLTYQLSIFGQDVLQVVSFGRWFMSAIICTLCTNLYCTALIIWRIWRINKIAQSYGGPKLASVIVILVESAAVSTLWTLFILIFYPLQNAIAGTMADTVVIVSGITSMLINVRVGMGSALRANHLTATMPSSWTFATQPEREPGSDGWKHTAQMASLVINITPETEEKTSKDVSSSLSKTAPSLGSPV